jgi:hypothetical protein
MIAFLGVNETKADNNQLLKKNEGCSKSTNRCFMVD